MKNQGLPFHLIDENTEKRYYFQTTLKNEDDIDEFCFTTEFEEFMEMMECGTDKKEPEKWSGVHDVDGEEDFPFGYTSYEIEDFPTAIRMWFDFFARNGKLAPDSKIITKKL